VADNGPGIAAHVLPQLFKPFVTTKQSGHVGLGLAAAYASLQHFGGRLEGRNSPTGGAVFEVTLPAAESTARVDVEPAIHDETAKRSARILAVDDDPDILNIIRDYLEPLGYHVTTLTDGDRAIELASSEPLDLVLCDVGMPRKSGLDVCVLLRQSGYQGRLVLMTGWERDSVFADQRAAKCDTLLQKPFVGKELVQVIDGLLTS
jgi:CheY-like chemotaxis protein